MSLRSSIRNGLRPWMRSYPQIKKWLGVADRSIDQVRHSVATHLPMIIKPVIRNVTVAITAHCNLRCVGCRYGRDFMVGSQLPWPVMKDLLTDAKALGVEVVRLYGGEPLLHPDLPRMIEYCTELRLATYITTNGILLKDKIDVLYKAGLRDITIGFYGNGQQYDDYVQRRNSFERMEEGFAAVRDRYGLNVNIRMNWLLMRPTCNPESLSAAWDLAQRYDMKFQVDLIQYSLPYFSEGHERELQFSAEDKPAINQIVNELVVLKQHHPDVFSPSLNSVKSIPGSLLKRRICGFRVMLTT
jgi:molybdenum cofactor biosynthesis enzyme MoaA